MTQPPFPSTIAAQPCHITFSDHKSRGQKKPGKRQSDGLPCLDKAVLAQGGGGVRGKRTS